jgi:hypothetical protein
LAIVLSHGCLRVGTKSLHAHLLFLGEVVGVGLHGGLCDLGALMSIAFSGTFEHVFVDLAFDITLLSDQFMLGHDLPVENRCLLLQSWLQESLTHLRDYLISLVAFEASELDPLSKETRSDLHSLLQVESIVLGAAENR